MENSAIRVGRWSEGIKTRASGFLLKYIIKQTPQMQPTIRKLFNLWITNANASDNSDDGTDGCDHDDHDDNSNNCNSNVDVTNENNFAEMRQVVP